MFLDELWKKIWKPRCFKRGDVIVEPGIQQKWLVWTVDKYSYFLYAIFPRQSDCPSQFRMCKDECFDKFVFRQKLDSSRLHLREVLALLFVCFLTQR